MPTSDSIPGFRINTDTQVDRRTEVTATGGEQPLSNLSIPLADLGVPIPYIIGRQRIFFSNSIWAGNVRPIVKVTEEITSETETERGPTGIGNFEVTTEVLTKTYETIGYNLSMQFALALGPGVVLKAIGVGDETLWEGTAGPDKTEITIPDNDSYITGDVIFYGGEFDQPKDTFLSEHIDPDFLPAYRGVAYIIVKDLRGDQISSGSPWFEVERFPNPLSLTDAANKINDKDVNVASALADYLSTAWGGAGVGMDAIDNASFVSAAAVLATENNGCSFQLNKETGTDGIVGVLTDQADGLVFEDPDTGTIKFRVIRFANLTPLTAIKLTDDVVTRVNNWGRASWVNTANKMRVSYTSRDEGYEKDNVLGYNFSAINDRIKKDRIVTRDFPAVSNETLAAKLLGRELNRLGQPTIASEIEANRVPSTALPGDTVQFFAPRHKLPPMLGVATKIRKFPLGDNRTILRMVQVPRGDTDIIFDNETSLSNPMLIDTEDPTGAVIIQPPYWLARKRGVNLLETNDSDFVMAMVLPQPGDDVQASFDAYIVNKPNSSNMVRVTEGAPYPTSASLNGTIDEHDDIDDGIIASITIDNVTNSTFLVDEGETGVREGRLLMLIDDEFMSFESVTDNMDGTYTLTNVHRALLDTVAQDHADDADVYIIGRNYGIISKTGFNYPLGYTPDWRITSNTAFAKADPQSDYFATSTWDLSNNRIKAALRPHNTEVDGAARSAMLTNALGEEGYILERGQAVTVTWATRSRSALEVALQLDAAEDGEIDENGDYQVHRVLIRDSGSSLRDCGNTANDGNYNSLSATPPVSTDLGLGHLFVRAETIYGNSLYEDRLPVFILASAYLINEAGTEYVVSEDGTELLVDEA